MDVCASHVARYKLPKAIIRTPKIERSPAGKADYRWASDVAINAASDPRSDAGAS